MEAHGCFPISYLQPVQSCLCRLLHHHIISTTRCVQIDTSIIECNKIHPRSIIAFLHTNSQHLHIFLSYNMVASHLLSRCGTLYLGDCNKMTFRSMQVAGLQIKISIFLYYSCWLMTLTTGILVTSKYIADLIIVQGT